MEKKNSTFINKCNLSNCVKISLALKRTFKIIEVYGMKKNLRNSHHNRFIYSAAEMTVALKTFQISADVVEGS